MRRTLLAVVLPIAFTGCATTLVPGAEKVRVTKNPRDVTNCKVVQPVTGFEKEMQNKAVALRADTVLKTETAWATPDYVEHGMAYNCSGVDPRQPVPVTKPQ